jgi:D-alanine-D-alanine ligase
MAAVDAAGSVSILVLYSRVEEIVRGEAVDILAEQETALVAREICAGLRRLGYRASPAGATGDVAQALAPYEPAEWLVFNLCESPGGDPSLEATVPALLDELGFAHTGSGAATLSACLDKAGAKKWLAAHGLPTPRYAVVSSPNDPCRVPFPALVKPVSEDASVGISDDSVVCDAGGLARQVAYILERYRQPALVEEFVAGREFNLAIWGNDPPEPLPIAEICYEGYTDPLRRLLTYESKWVAGSYAYSHTPGVCPAQVDPILGRRLLDAALSAYRLMGCRGYARVDVRERDGIPYILEVNPNPSLASDAGFARAARAAGYDHARMAGRIVGFALERTPAACGVAASALAGPGSR